MPENGNGTTNNAGANNNGGGNANADLGDFRELLREAVSSAGKGTGLAEREERLLSENFRVREKYRQLREQQAAIKPLPEGSLVLTKEQADAYNAFQALGVPPKDLKDRLNERDNLLQAQARRDADKLVADVAGLIDVNPRALQRLVTAEGLTVELKTVKVRDEESGKMVEEQVPVVRRKGADPKAEAEDLLEVLEKEYAEDIPLLTATSGSGDAGAVARDAFPVADGMGGDVTLPAGRRTLRQSDETVPVGGARFPATRSTPPVNGNNTRKALEKEVEAKHATGRYRI